MLRAEQGLFHPRAVLYSISKDDMNGPGSAPRQIGRPRVDDASLDTVGTKAELQPTQKRVVQVTAPPSMDSPNLDLLRSIAAAFVLIFHVLLFFSASELHPANLVELGHWGVLMFFVHTSLVLMLSLERQRQRSPGRSLFGAFMLRRCFRLLPLSMLIVLFVVIFDLPVGHLRDGLFSRVKVDAKVILSNLLLVQDLTRTESVMATLWSLSYEMQMYLTLPLLFLFARSVRTLRPLLALWVGSVVFSSSWLRWGRNDLIDFPQYVPCFLAGIIAFRLGPVTRRSWPPLLWPVALATLTVAYLAHPTRIVGMFACLALGAIIPRFRELNGKRTRRFLQLFARYSYGLYLTHFICVWFAFDAIHAYPAPVRWITFLVTVVGCPIILYHAVEAPMISVGARVVDRLRRAAAPAAAA